MNTIEKMDKLSTEHTDLIMRIFDLWAQEIVFTWRWWLGVILTVLTWLFWMRFHNKESRNRLLTAGFFVMALSVSLDAIGVQVGLWSYRYEVLPFIPAYVPYDLALMPVVVMLLIQFKPEYSAFKKSIAFGLLSAFVGEPFIVFLDIYKPLEWQFVYSLPIYMMIFLIAHWLTFSNKYQKMN